MIYFNNICKGNVGISITSTRNQETGRKICPTIPLYE